MLRRGFLAGSALLPLFAEEAHAQFNSPSRGNTFDWVNIKTDWGATGNGVTDDSQAFLNFQRWAQTQTTGVFLVIPPGSYNISVKAGRFFVGIANLNIYGYGATLANFGRGGPIPAGPVGTYSARINSTAEGDTTVTLITSSQSSLFTVGRWVCISSLDMQGGLGSPPNWYYFEYRQITGINSGAGVITLDAPLRYAHLSTFPCPTLGSPIYDAGGPASIFKMDQGWVQSVKALGLTANGYVGLSARDFECVDMVFPVGMGPSASEHIVFRNCQFLDGGDGSVEVDKLISFLAFVDCVFAAQLVIQSASVDRLVVDGCEIYSQMGGTPAKVIHIRNSYINKLNLGGQYGPGGSVLLDSSRIDAIAPGYASDYIPAGNIKFSDGTFYIPNASPNLYQMWPFAVPGAQAFCMYGDGAGPGLYPFIVTGVRQDGTNTYMDTTLSSVVSQLTTGATTFPLFGFGVHVCPRLTAFNNTGCADVIDASKGRPDNPIYSYSKRAFTGTIAYGNYRISVLGNVVSININVVQAYTGAQSTLNFGIQTLLLTTPTTGALTQTQSTVNAKIAGLRTITPAGTTGSQSGDSIAALSGWSWGSVYPWFDQTISGDAINKWPLVELEIITDQGVTRILYFARWFDVGDGLKIGDEEDLNELSILWPLLWLFLVGAPLVADRYRAYRDDRPLSDLMLTSALVVSVLTARGTASAPVPRLVRRSHPVSQRRYWSV